MDFINQFELWIRLSAFFGVFLCMALFEVFTPRRKARLARSTRWFTNSALVVVGSLCVRLIVPVLAMGMAGIANAKGWGLLSMVKLAPVMEIAVAIVILDLLIYAQHVATHKIEFLWRFHKVHHADLDMDVTTGFRFHPLEIVFSMFFKVACVALIGAPAIAVFLFEVTLNASAMFNHSNIRLPSSVDSLLRKVIVTPDMHRVHHSIVREETDSNYGFFLSIWDRVFKTYIAQPEAGHLNMVIGLPEQGHSAPSSLIWSLIIPFQAPTKLNK